MLFHRTLNANHSNARRWRTWATTVKRAVAKTNGFLICPCKNLEWIAMLLLQGKDERVILCEWKQKGSALAAVDCSAASCEGAVREKAELLELCARYMIPPCPSSLSCPPWEKRKSGRFGSGGTSCGKMNCERLPVGTSCAGELARRRRGRARAPGFICAMGWKEMSVRHYRWLRDEHFEMLSESSVY